MPNMKVEGLSNKAVVTMGVRIMLAILAVLLICIFIFIGVLLAYSPGKPEPFLDENRRPIVGSISEKIRININGVEQGMFIKGKDKTKPVLLFLHGGPGMPNAWISGKYPPVFEDFFTVCYWEQRGAGLSYNPGIDAKTMTAEQLISDTLEVTDYLRRRFRQERIYLLGHSYGSFIGIQAASKAPELYKAYIGMAQISKQFESEKLAYKYMVEYFTKAGDKGMLKKLEKFPIPDMDAFPNSYRSLRDEAMHCAGIGTTRNMKSVISGVFMPVNLNREYTPGEKINLWRGKWSAGSTNLWNKMMEADLTKNVAKLDIPVYFFHGIYDYTVAYPLTKDYFEKLEAPMKGFYTFEKSAHSPFVEEPEKMQHILMKDVLSGINSLSDKK